MARKVSLVVTGNPLVNPPLSAVLAKPFHRVLLEGGPSRHQRKQIIAAVKKELGYKKIQIRHIENGLKLQHREGYIAGEANNPTTYQEYIVYYTPLN